MKLIIAHLYYDLLNLYGENGNLKALKKQLEDQGIKVIIKNLSINDTLDFNSYDLVYMGMGTEENQKLALKHLLPYKDTIKECIENNHFFLITGNSLELFGKHIMDIDNKKHKALNIFDFEAKEQSTSVVGELTFKCSLIKDDIIGFQNRRSIGTSLNDYPLFEVIKGIGSNPHSNNEGIHYHNFYGTYVIGPLLVRNPKFLTYFTKELINYHNKKFKFKAFDVKVDTLAYHNFKQNFPN